MELSTHLLCPSHQLRKKGRISCFARFITTLNTLPRIDRPSVGFFTGSLGGNLGTHSKGARSAKEPSTQPQKKGVVAIVIHRNPAEVEESEGSFHPRTVRTLQKNLKFKSLFNQLGFRSEARRVAIESLMSIAVDSGMECFTAESNAS